MKISEFVIGRNIEKQAVYRYVTRHEELLSQCTKEGKELDMPMEVVMELEKQYPMPKPTIIINGVPHEEHNKTLEELSQIKSAFIVLQNELADHKLLLAEKEYGFALIEEKNNAEKQRLEEENARLKAEIDAEKKKTWLQRLIGK